MEDGILNMYICLEVQNSLCILDIVMGAAGQIRTLLVPG